MMEEAVLFNHCILIALRDMKLMRISGLDDAYDEVGNEATRKEDRHDDDLHTDTEYDDDDDPSCF